MPEAPTGEAAPVETGPLDNVVTAYHRTLLTFGHVEALAPVSMTVLNTDPNLVNLPLADLITQSPLPFLLGTLTPDQWQKLASGPGLGFADLSADQQSLLRAALPTTLKVAPTSTSLPMLESDKIKNWTADDWGRFNKTQKQAQQVRDAQTQTIPDDLLARDARFRLFLGTDYTFDVPGQSGYGIGVSPTPRDGPKPNTFELTDVWTSQQQSGDRLSKYFKAEVPNELKDGDLHWTRHELRARITLDRLKSVDDLVARLAQATGLELYADPNFGSQTLTVVGHAEHPQEADDVMQALALCVCGAWRQLGPAWVLTDDVQGLATRRAKIKEIVEVWSSRLQRASEGIGDRLQERHWAQTLPFIPGDPAALPDSLRARVAGTRPGEGFGTGISFQDLPPATQAGLRGGLRDYAEGTGLRASATKVQSGLTPQTPVHISFALHFALDLPGLGTVLLDFNPYRPQSSSPAPPAGGADASIKIPDRVLLTESRRVILCAPHTPAQARAIVDKLAAMGFNTFFCDVSVVGEADEPRAILTAAIAEGVQKHVAVYAALDTLCWRQDAGTAHPQPLPDGISEDVTVQDETLFQAVSRHLDTVVNPYERTSLETIGARRWVSLADPRVATRLEHLVQSLAAVPGLAGLTFQDTAPPGYLGGGDSGDSLNIELGYTLAQRLAYLRANHADPEDIGGQGEGFVALRGGDASATLDIAIPSYNGMVIDGSQKKLWSDWRGLEEKTLLAGLWATAHQVAPRLPLWMREQRIGFTFDPWTDPKTPDKAADLRSEGNALAQRVTVYSILVPTFPGWLGRLADLSGDIRQFRQEFGNGKASGMLLDLTAGTPDADPLHTLDSLSPLFTPDKPKPGPSTTVTVH